MKVIQKKEYELIGLPVATTLEDFDIHCKDIFYLVKMNYSLKVPKKVWQCELEAIDVSWFEPGDKGEPSLYAFNEAGEAILKFGKYNGDPGSLIERERSPHIWAGRPSE